MMIATPVIATLGGVSLTRSHHLNLHAYPKRSSTKMALLKKIVGGLVGIVVLVIAAGFLLPSTVHVERDIVIDAPPAKVFALISDFEAGPAWSSWADLDPEATMEITGSGLGQTMNWTSTDPDVGIGSQQIVQLDSPSLLKTHLEFGELGMADALFELTPADDQTKVTWSLDTDMREGVPLWLQPVNTYLGFLMDSMVGESYEQGLENLKTAVES
ncbi:MAG: SRPBCC family protein [Cyanobacteria bacterium J06635_15]